MTLVEQDVLQGPLAPAVTHEMAPQDAPSLSAGSEKRVVLGSFWIGDAEFALPVSAIREVVNETDAVSDLPLSPPFLLGLFNVRGLIIPLIDLRILLNLPEPAPGDALTDTRKVAIVEDKNKCVGILFDSAGEMLNKPASVKVSFQTNEEKTGMLIEGVLKLDGGDRLVRIIDPHEVLRIEGVPQAEVSANDGSHQSKRGKRLSCVSFQVGHTSCAMDLRYVQEVTDMPPVETHILKGGAVIGTTDLRDQTIPIVDFRSFLGTEPVFSLGEEQLMKRKLLVIQTDGGLIGLMVFSIDSIIPFYENDVLPFAKLALPREDIVQGCIQGDDEDLVMLLNYEQLRADPGLTDPASACVEIYNLGKTQVEKAAAAEKATHMTFIVFSIDNTFAMDTRQVSEVINRPASLSEPPFALDFVEGIINLRGELITLINLRRLHGADPCESNEQKVVIFTDNDQKFAILVDTVDEMVTTNSDKVKLSDDCASVRRICETAQDVKGLLECEKPDGGSHAIGIMDGSGIVERCAQV